MSFRFIDLFAGVGGLRIPFEELGGECVFTSEIDRHAQKTYLWNHGELPHGDIKEIAVDDIPGFDLLLAGFPCQPFSNAGLRKGFADTRGTLFYEIERIIEHHQPKVVVLENVKGLLNHDKGQTLATIINVLEERLEYNVSKPQVLNAREFGVPQRRERLVLVATKGVDKFEYQAHPPRYKNLGTILQSEDEVDSKYVISDRLWESHKARKARHLQNGNGFGYSLFDENSEATRTISARYYKDGSEILISRGNANPRKLTPREALRLQGFPEKFRIPVSDNQLYKQMGNSVAVPVFRHIAEQAVRLIDPKAKKVAWSPASIKEIDELVQTLPPKDAKFFRRDQLRVNTK